MTKTLYDPAVEERGREEGKINVAINLLDILSDEVIADKTELPLEKIKELRKEFGNK